MREDLALANFLRILLESIASLQTIFLHFSVFEEYKPELLQCLCFPFFLLFSMLNLVKTRELHFSGLDLLSNFNAFLE